MSRPTEHGEIWRAIVDKPRPVVVVSRDDARGVRARATVAIVSSTIRSIRTEVLLDHNDGLDHACAVNGVYSIAVNADELFTMDKSRLERRIGRLRPEKLDALHDALRFALELR